MPRHPILLSAALLGTLVIAGCGPDPAPDKPKEPTKPVGNTELRDAIEKPIDRAKGVEKTIQDSKDAQDKQLDDVGA